MSEPLNRTLTDVDERIAAAPMPTRSTLRRRSSLPLQSVRFVLINLKIIRMVLKGH